MRAGSQGRPRRSPSESQELPAAGRVQCIRCTPQAAQPVAHAGTRRGVAPGTAGPQVGQLVPAAEDTRRHMIDRGRVGAAPPARPAVEGEHLFACPLPSWRRPPRFGHASIVRPRSLLALNLPRKKSRRGRGQQQDHRRSAEAPGGSESAAGSRDLAWPAALPGVRPQRGSGRSTARWAWPR